MIKRITLLVQLLILFLFLATAETQPDLNECGLTIIETEQGYGVYSQTGETIIVPVWKEIEYNGNGTYKVKSYANNLYGLISEDGRVILNNEWEHIYPCSENRVFCEKNFGDAYLFNLDGNSISSGYTGAFICDFQYEFEGGLASVKTNGGNFYIDLSANVVGGPYCYATGFSCGYAVVLDSFDSDVYIIDHDFNRVELPQNWSLADDLHQCGNFIVFDGKEEVYLIYNLISLDCYGPFSTIVRTFDHTIYLMDTTESDNRYFCFDLAESTISEVTEEEAICDFD